MKPFIYSIERFGKALAASIVAINLFTAANSACAQTSDGWLTDLTVDGASRLRGMTRFGSLGEDVAMDGFRVDVIQTATQRLREIVTPGGTHTEVTPVYTYSPSYHDWTEEQGHSENRLVLVAEAQQAYSVATEVVDEEAVPAHLGPEHEGNLISPGSAAYDEMVHTGEFDDFQNERIEIVHHEATNPIYEIVRDLIPGTPAVTHTEYAYYPAQEAVYEWRETWVVDNVIPHHDYTGYIVSETQEVTTVTEPDIVTSESYVDYSAVTARFTGTRQGLTWVWRNWQDTSGSTMRDLMTLSEGGLLLPHPADINATSSISYNKFEQSWSGIQETQGGGTVSRTFGSSMERDKIAVWNGSGDATTGLTTDQDRIEIAPDGMTVKSQNLTPTGQSQNTSTHITSGFASFGGNVAVKGVVRMMPAGDIDMGQYQNGPRP